MYIIMLGAPGTGKGTIGNEICEKYKLEHIATGDIFRDEIKNGANSHHHDFIFVTPCFFLFLTYLDKNRYNHNNFVYKDYIMRRT